MVQALKAGGKLQAQDGAFGDNSESVEYTEAILAGLVASGAEGMVKPESSASEAVPLQFGKKRDKSSAVSDAIPNNYTSERKAEECGYNTAEQACRGRLCGF